MYISLNWLKDYVRIPSKIKPEDIAKELTNHTVEVEGLVNSAEQFDKIVVGKVLEVVKHPNADRLRLTVVDVKKKKLNIVCGAPNIAPGQMVAVATAGALLPNGLEIKESLIRGHKSEGMICAEDELGLGKNHEVIMVLKESAKIGEAFAKYLKADDIIFEIDNKSLSNRPDLLNHYGLARELAAIFNLRLLPYEKKFARQGDFLDAKNNRLEVKVSAPDACPRYLAVKVSGIEIKESPAWLKERLVAVNQRPINNIVDLTNYIMFDCGQPMHAFDAAKIKKILVRQAEKNETIETLDEKERVLSVDDLVITDGRQAVALAGIMGGRSSEITPETKELVLESANFSAATVRRTSQKLNLRTESSIRFEKALDPTLPETAIFRFLTLLKEICPSMKIASPLIDINNTRPKQLTVELDLGWLKNKIGQEIPRADVISILEKLGFSLDGKKEEILKVSIPSWRATKDISSKEDLAEEILRLYGYDKIEAQLPTLAMDLPEVNETGKIERKIKNILCLQGSLSEAYNYSFVGADQLKKLNIDFFNYLKLANPLSGIQNLLRQSLAPGLVANIKTNQFKSADFGFFEIGNVFFKTMGNVRKDDIEGNFLPYQEKHLGLVIAGGGDLFGRLKSAINSLFKNLFNPGIETEFLVLDNLPGWADKYSAAKVVVLGQELGVVGWLSHEATVNLNLKKATALAELNFNKLVELIFNQPPFRFTEAPKYPPLMRDLAFVAPNKILYNDLRREISRFNPLIKSVELFDIYIGNKLAGGQKSLAFHLSYRAEDRTLTAEEVDKIQAALIAYLAQKFEAKLRDF
ncbi:MAG: phenylalanine--tRNA ligase subunit beta [bacterium]|nr:phenylalanine--tRNA ligase subunit beta [bacterium]